MSDSTEIARFSTAILKY